MFSLSASIVFKLICFPVFTDPDNVIKIDTDDKWI